MAIDISTDLSITLLAKEILTPTITSVYDTGSPPDTYLPGKDFSPTDDVSTGTTVQMSLSISFDSISNQLYILDQVYIQSIDDPQTNGTGNFLIYWINTNPDPTNITDDGQNTILPNYVSKMSSIVFAETSNISSTSTLTTNITITLPVNGFYWKTKIMPKIQVVAIKDGIKKISSPLQLPTVRLSTASNLVSTIGTISPTGYVTLDNQTGFLSPFFIRTFKEDIASISRMLDNPKYNLITYQINLTGSVNGNNIPLNTSNFSIYSINNGEIISYNYLNNILTIVCKQTVVSTQLSLSAYFFIPFNAGSLTEATVKINGTWNTTPPLITDFENRHLFTESSSGNINQETLVNLIPTPPASKPRLSETISATLASKTVYQALSFNDYPCIKTDDSIFIKLIDSPIASFNSTLTATYSYYDVDINQSVTNPVLSDSYTVLYAHYDFPSNYNANNISQQIIDGLIPLTSYNELVEQNKTANIVVITYTKDLFAGKTTDASNVTSFQFNGGLNVLSQAQFQALYNSNPLDSYPTYVYSYMSIKSCYSSVAEAYTQVGNLLENGGIPPSIDSFTLRNGSVYLNLGTTTQNEPFRITRFNTNSTVYSLVPLETIDANLRYALLTSSNTLITNIFDYSKEYYLSINWATQPSTDNAFVNIPEGTTITITLPQALLPYLYISNTPYINVPTSDDLIVMKVPIPNYNSFGATLTLTLPMEVNLLPNHITIPVRFIIPSNNLSTSFVSMDFSKPLIYKQDPNSLIYGFDTTTKMFKVNTFTRPFTLIGAQQDTTSLYVSPNVYEYAQPVTYTASVKNISYVPSSDYYMSMTVPTNQYNPVETSNNTLNAYIIDIDLGNSNTTLYYQIQSNVTGTDIEIMKTINRPLGPTLKDYYDTTIMNTWIKYIPGQMIPNTVVMMVAYTPNVPKDAAPVRINYRVKVGVPSGSNQLYINDAVFNYYSSGANLESQSNVVSIRNQVPEALPISKTPTTQYKPLLNDTPVIFNAYFITPNDNSFFQDFKLMDQLHPGLALDLTNTTLVAYPNTPLMFTSNVDPTTNTVSIEFPNTAESTGKLIILTLATVVLDTTKILLDPATNTLLIKNTIDLIINADEDLKSTSNEASVVFHIPLPPSLPITKMPLEQTQPLVSGTPILFSAHFTAPAEIRVYNNFTLEDSLDSSLTFDLENTKVIADGNIPIPFTSFVDPTSNTVTIDFLNNSLIAGKDITATLATTLSDITKVPSSLLIENEINLTLINIPLTKSTSNRVTVRFSKSTPPRQQAVIDIIESVALIQAALSHILNAEGEKLQKIINLPDSSPDVLVQTNHSVQAMVTKITTLEMLLQNKLELFEECLCDSTPCQLSSIQDSNKID